MKPFFAALSFLTVCPSPAAWSGAAELSRSTWFFPPVGLLIGGLLAGLALGLQPWLPPLVLAVVLVMAGLAVSKGLHLDGLADSADAFLSSRPPERMLEIMKDSRSGPMGVMAIVLVLLLQTAALSGLPTAWLWRAAILMPLAGRAAIAIQLGLVNYARREGGLATVFCGVAGRRLVPWWAAGWVGLAGWTLAGWAGVAVAAAGIATTLLFCLVCVAKIRGFTGDTLGAACELSETAVAVAIAALAVRGIQP
jgi:adenosylcobinamide-GDP ribazoletransferase